MAHHVRKAHIRNDEYQKSDDEVGSIGQLLKIDRRYKQFFFDNLILNKLLRGLFYARTPPSVILVMT